MANARATSRYDSRALKIGRTLRAIRRMGKQRNQKRRAACAPSYGSGKHVGVGCFEELVVQRPRDQFDIALINHKREINL